MAVRTLYVIKTSMSQNEMKTERAYDAARVVRTDCGRPILSSADTVSFGLSAGVMHWCNFNAHAANWKRVDCRAIAA